MILDMCRFLCSSVGKDIYGKIQLMMTWLYVGERGEFVDVKFILSCNCCIMLGKRS